MSDYSIKSSWSRFLAPRGRMIVVGRAAAQRAAERAAAGPEDPESSRAEASVVQREGVATWEDDGGAPAGRSR